MIWQRKVSLNFLWQGLVIGQFWELVLVVETKNNIDENLPSTLLATIAAPGITLAATAASNVDSIDGIAYIMNYM